MIRILLLDDHALFREGLVRLLASEPDFELAAPCGDVEQALRVVQETWPDVVLLDVDLGDKRGSEFLVRAREQGFTGSVLIVTAGVSDREMGLLLAHGVSGVIFKHSPPERLFQGIRDAVAGRVSLDPRLLALQEAAPAAPERPSGRLTDREREVLTAVFEGLSNKEIADRMSISESSVKATLQQLFQKSGVRTRSRLVRIALEKYSDQI